jgi:hypothetical protein
MSDLAGQLREYTALRYMGDCKCGNCRLVPRPFIDVVADRIEALEAALRKVRKYCETMDLSRSETLIALVHHATDAALAPEQDK